ncbi:MAG: DNA translocase FtsK [Muribaculaceae bacterium]|nr:DNA translocase FtsK [Muribaculaceae bacterium]
MNRYDNYTPELPFGNEPPKKEEEETVMTIEPQVLVKERKKVAAHAAPREKKPKPVVKPVELPKIDLDKVIENVKRWANMQTVRLLTGCFLGCLGLYLFVCFMSYFVTCVKDQSLILNTPNGTLAPVSNAGGEGGARLSEVLINESFGVGSFVMIFWLLAMSLKQLLGWPRFKSVNFTIKCVVAMLTISLIVGLLTIGFQTSVNWGGYHGRYVNEFIVGYVGWSGAGLVCLFMVAAFVVICLRDLINWILRLKHKRDERKRKEAELRALEEQRDRELEEMRRMEAVDAVKAGEQAAPDEGKVADEEDAVVTFGVSDSSFYATLPDFDEEDKGQAAVNPVAQDEAARAKAAEEARIEAEAAEAARAEVATATTVPETTAEPEHIAQAASKPVINQQPAVITTESHTVPASPQPQSVADAPKTDNKPADETMVVHVNQIAAADGPSVQSGDSAVPGVYNYVFPPYDLLRAGNERISVDADEQMENKERIRKTLLDFGIPILHIEATVGPTVTLYEILPDKGVRIAKIRSLVDDIALSLSAIGVRIIAPIPGKGTVGIEVANKDPQTVSMRTVIKSRKFQESKCRLPIALGSTISNDVYIADLAKMPHLLVAGATGQGKSVGLNAIIASLLYRRRPDELKFVMIDPKMVEFSLYAKIEKHYLAKLPDEDEPIITDMSKVVATLSSLCVEMDDRYLLLKAAHARNIEEYNAKIKAHKLNPLEGHKFLPYIVVIVDEFSDLIMTSGKEVEMPIARLAQKARAVGMHVIIATQRPSTNVITGIIKANFPARIAFKVSSGIDSKTILDTPGAQQLIGRGDMLISNNSEMIRVQCAFIDTPEVEEICDYIERQPYGSGAYILPEPKVTGNEDEQEYGSAVSERDPLFEEVARLIVTSNTASTSSLQRRYSIGYNRAGKIMDQLEAAGVVGPSHGGKPRAVLMDPATLESILNAH